MDYFNWETLNEAFYYLMIIGYSEFCSYLIKQEYNGSIWSKMSLVFFGPILILVFAPIFFDLYNSNGYLPLYLALITVNLFTLYLVNKEHRKEHEKTQLMKKIRIERNILRELVKDRIIKEYGIEEFESLEKDYFYSGNNNLKAIYKGLEKM